MGKWDKYKKNKDNKKEKNNTNKTNINCLIAFFPILLKNCKIRKNKELDLTYFFAKKRFFLFFKNY